LHKICTVIIGVVITVSVIFCGVDYCTNAQDETIIAGITDETVIISGKSDLENTYITLLILKPTFKIDDLNNDTILNATETIKEIQTDKDGEFTFEYEMSKDSVSGQYTVYVGADGDDQVLQTDFNYADILTRGTSAGWQGLKKIIEMEYTYLGIDLSVYNLLTSLNQATVCQELQIAGFSSKTKFSEQFNQLVKEYYAKQTSGSNRNFSGGGGGGRGTVIEEVISGMGLFADVPISKIESFEDLAEVPWAIESINNLLQKGVVEGDGGGYFYPNYSVTRAEFVKMIISAFGLTNDSANCDFNDVPNNHWAYLYIASAVDLDIVVGTKLSTFSPEDYISREQAATILYRTTIKLEFETPNEIHKEFIDSNDISPYAAEAIREMQKFGSVINGYDDGKFYPKSTCTRAMAAKMVSVLLGEAEK